MAEEKILVIDDEPGVRTALKGILEDEGFEVESAGSAKRVWSGPTGNDLTPSCWMSGCRESTAWKPLRNFRISVWIRR